MLSSTNAWHVIPFILALMLLVLIIWALATTLRSTTITAAEKVIWALILLVTPPFGLIVWALVWQNRRRIKITN